MSLPPPCLNPFSFRFASLSFPDSAKQWPPRCCLVWPLPAPQRHFSLPCNLVWEERDRPSCLRLEEEGNSISHFQWALDYVPSSHGDNIPTAELTSQTRPDPMPRFPIAKKNVIIPCVVNHLCYLHGTHWCRLQCTISWPFWLGIMAVTWLYLPLPLSRLGLRNLEMWAWAVSTLKVYKVFTRVSRGPSLAKRRLCLGPAGVINCTPLLALSFWVSLFPRTHGYNSSYLGLLLLCECSLLLSCHTAFAHARPPSPETH